MRIVELPPDNPNPAPRTRVRRVYRTSEEVYRGPPDSFPYDAFRAFGVVQLVLGSILCVIGLVQTTLSYDDRAVVLVSGAVVIWCPLFAIAAGLLGMLFTKRRYWEAECMKIGFIVTSSIAALLMLVMIAVVIFVQFYYYDIINLKPVDTFKWLDKRNIDDDAIDGYKAMVILIVILGGLEFLVALGAASMGCCFADTYEPDSKLERRSTKSQSQTGLVEQPSIIEQPPVQEVRYVQEPQIQFIQQPPPMQFVQEPMFIQQPPMQFAPPHLMTSPPPSLVYMA